MKRSAMNITEKQTSSQKQKTDTPLPKLKHNALQNNSNIWTQDPDLAQGILNQRYHEEQQVLEKFGSMKIP
jgi:hypothetical protein